MISRSVAKGIVGWALFLAFLVLLTWTEEGTTFTDAALTVGVIAGISVLLVGGPLILAGLLVGIVAAFDWVWDTIEERWWS